MPRKVNNKKDSNAERNETVVKARRARNRNNDKASTILNDTTLVEEKGEEMKHTKSLNSLSESCPSELDEHTDTASDKDSASESLIKEKENLEVEKKETEDEVEKIKAKNDRKAVFRNSRFFLFRYLIDPINSITHYCGAILSVIGLIALNLRAASNCDGWGVLSVNIFGICLILLYTSSGTFHGFGVKNTKLYFVLQRMDHAFIFVLIAGSYAPACLVLLKEDYYGAYFFLFVVTLGFAGVIYKVFFFAMHQWINTILYIAIGWVAILYMYPLIKTLAWQGIILTVAGGVAYTVGGVIYALKPKVLQNNIYWRSHEVFHMFILLGSFIHYCAFYFYVII